MTVGQLLAQDGIVERLHPNRSRRSKDLASLRMLPSYSEPCSLRGDGAEERAQHAGATGALDRVLVTQKLKEHEEERGDHTENKRQRKQDIVVDYNAPA